MLQTTYSIVNFVTKRNIDFAIDSKTKDAFEKAVAKYPSHRYKYLIQIIR